MSWFPGPRRTPALDELPAMLLAQSAAPPLGKPGWLLELKYDGCRITAGIDGSGVTLRSRTGANATTWFPEVADGLAALPGGLHVLDGEVCVLDAQGRNRLDQLQDRTRRRRRPDGAAPVVYVVFDILVLDGRDVTERPLEERKALLAGLLDPLPATVRLARQVPVEQAQRLMDSAIELQLDAVVAKRLGSPYQPGVRSKDWLKCPAVSRAPGKP